MRSLPHVTLQPSLPRRSAAKAGPSQSNPVKPSQTQSKWVQPYVLGWRQLVATTAACRPTCNDCEADVRPTSNC